MSGMWPNSLEKSISNKPNIELRTKLPGMTWLQAAMFKEITD